MKISIITVTLNSERTIRDTINSVLSQSYKDIEHIFVDGGSTDSTVKILKKNPNKNKKIFIKRNSSIYEAINMGIEKTSGKIIHILNSDDILENNNIIEETIYKIKKFPNCDIFFGNVIYFSNNNFTKISRYFLANHKTINNTKKGLMPPHPGSFVRKKVYDQYGLYNTDLKIASDFDFLHRILKIKKLKYKILNIDVVRMRTGGTSGKFITSYLKITSEIIRSLRNQKTDFSKFSIFMRFVHKSYEYFSYNQNYLNKKFQRFRFIYDLPFYNKVTINILNKIKFIPFKKNFILSALNLAFLGYIQKKTIYPISSLYTWPDGIFAKKFINYDKISGAKLLQKLIIPGYIKKIHVFGNLTDVSKKFLIKRYKKEIIHTKLSYKPVDKQNLDFSKITKNEIIFITLPTPKQEILAYLIKKKLSFYKIICIGGAISIASKEITDVPKFLINHEYIWRLKTDTIRRLIRLFDSYFYYLIGKYTGKYQRIIFNKIEE